MGGEFHSPERIVSYPDVIRPMDTFRIAVIHSGLCRSGPMYGVVTMRPNDAFQVTSALWGNHPERDVTGLWWREGIYRQRLTP